jgi:hypothetical protein
MQQARSTTKEIRDKTGPKQSRSARKQVHNKTIGTDSHRITQTRKSQETLTSPRAKQSAAKEQLVRGEVSKSQWRRNRWQIN